MARGFTYRAAVAWTGNRGTGTSAYQDYGRDFDIAVAGKPTIKGSSDSAFRGDAGRHNPEDLLVASLAACHMLWYLHLAAEAGIVVLAYEDAANGEMALDAGGGGRFTSVTLRPTVTISSGGDAGRARDLHAAAHEKCFIANSVAFPVTCDPTIVQATE